MNEYVKKWFALLILLGASVLWNGCTAKELAISIPETKYLKIDGNRLIRVVDAPDVRMNRKNSREETETADDLENLSLLVEEASTHFAYDSLTNAERIWYRDIEACLGSMVQEIRLSEEGIKAGLDETCIDRIFQCVMCDHPEIFYVDGYSYSKYTRGDSVVAISFSGTYNMEKQEAVSRKKIIELSVENLLSGVDTDAPDYDQVRFVYETLIRNTDYDLEAVDNQNIYSVFVGHASVCLGYAKATQYLLNCLGIECALVQGMVDPGEGHAWNLVKVDDSYYYVDTTWGDASYQTMGDEQGDGGYQPTINYDYLCVTTEQLLRTHTIGGVVDMPVCTATQANYYVRENAFFTTYDKEQMTQLFAKAEEQGKEDVTVKCADVDCFLLIKETLIDRQEIFDYMPEGESVAYASNDKQLSLTFWRN